MPIVNVKGVGKIRFPDTMTKEEIHDVLRRKFGPKRPTKGFLETLSKSYAQADEDYAIGKLTLENDKEYAIDLLELEYGDWKNNASPGEQPAPFWSRENWGEMVGGVGRDMIVGGTTLVGGSFVSTPIGGVVASGAVVTTLQTITAKGGSFRDAYTQIRNEQDRKGFVDKEAAYEVARKISNNDAAIAALESGLTTLIPIKGIGGPLKQAITRPVAEGAFDAAVGATGSIASDIQAEAIGGDLGVDRGDLWENASRAAFQELAIGAPSNIANTFRGVREYKKGVAQEKQRLENIRENYARAQEELYGTSTMAAIRGEESGKRETAADPIVIDEQYLRQKETTQLQESQPLTENEKKSFHPTYKAVDKEGATPGKKRIEGANQQERDAKKRKVSKETATDSRLVVPPDINNTPDMGMGTEVNNPNMTPILDANGNVISQVPRVAMPESSVDAADVGTTGRIPQAERARTEADISQLTRTELNRAMELTDARIKQLSEQKTKGQYVPESSIPLIGQGPKEGISSVDTGNVPLPAADTFIMDVLSPTRNEKGIDAGAEAERLSDLRGRLEAQRVADELAEAEAEIAGVSRPEPLKTARQLAEGKAEIIAAMKELGDLSKFGMGVDPTPIWKAVKGLAKVAGYYYGRGVDTAENFAKAAGLKLTKLVRKVWDSVVNRIPLTPKDLDGELLADIGNPTSTADGQAEKTLQGWFSEKKTNTIRKLVDSFIDLDELQKKVANGEAIPDTNNTYQAEQLMHGKIGALMTDFNKKVDALLNRASELKITIPDIEKFVYALHAKERNDHIADINPRFQDGGSGMTNKAAADIIEAVTKSGKLEAYMEIADALKEINDKTLDVQFDGGLISLEEYNNLKNFYQRYVPLKGHTDSDPRIHKTGNHVNVDFNKKENPYALGHGERSTDLLAYSFEKHANALVRAERNKVYQTLASWVQDNPDNGVITIGEPTLKQEYNKATAQVVVKPDPNWTAREDVLALKVNGELTYLRISNIPLANNLKQMGVASMPKAMQFISGIQRWLAMANTTLNPDFILPNFVRDVATAGVNLNAEETASLLKDMNPKRMAKLGKAIWGMERGNTNVDPEIKALYDQFRAEGGKMEFAQMLNLDSQIRKIEKYSSNVRGLSGVARKTAELKGVKQLYGATIGVMQTANTVAENATRFSVFSAAINSGKFTPKQAAFLARNITVNFTKKGDAGKYINALYLFYNASIQGSLRILQATKSPRVRKLLYGIMTLGATENMMNQLFGGDEDEDGFTPYDKIPEYVKQSNMIISLPYTDKVLTIPLPYGYNAVYYAGKQMTSVIPALGGKKKPMDAAADLGTTVVNAFNPIGGSQNITRAVLPELGKLVFDLKGNEDWKGDRIRPERNPFSKYEIPKSEMYWSTVNPLSKNATRLVNEFTGGDKYEAGYFSTSPENLDYAFGFLAGGIGKTINRVTKGAIDLAQGKGLGIEDIPVVRRFQEDPSPYFEIQKYKELRNAVNAAVAEIKDLKKAKASRSEIEASRKENMVELKLNSSIKKTDTALEKINDSINTVKLHPKLSSAQKSKKLEELNDKRRLILRTTIRKFVDAANRQ